ncbi:BLOC-2 complex member HPS6 [Antennarius striatus]|uniref:BLOC-2 complex member HPS6 n=1 Tax=Antennarius striatus TaxID=241820 RepID=UPI0035B396CB
MAFMLEQLSDFGDYTGCKELTEIFNVSTNELKLVLSNVRVSPDGRHLHVLLCKPQLGLLTFDKNEITQVVHNQKRLELCLKRAVPVVDVLYLDHSNSSSKQAAAVVVYEDGKAEFWRFKEGKGSWHLSYTSDLCNSPRAKVVSVCACSNLIIWCEERPPSESAPSLGSTRNQLTYCVCRREFDVQEAIISLGGVKIALHNNPKFRVVSSGEYVYLLPDLKAKSMMSISSCFLSCSPFHETFTIHTTCKNAPLKRFSAKESDFKRLVTDCVGYLSALEPPEIYDFSPTGCGGLLLLLSTGRVCVLQKEGMLRQVYKLSDNYLVKSSTHTSICLYEDTLALLIGRNLYLVDVNCGRELQKITLKREGLLFVNRAKRFLPHLLSDNGLFVMTNKESESRDHKPSGFSTAENIHPGARLVEAVFEEACKYYQQRSLSRTQLTVDTLKKGGRFQAPISLASILRNYLSNESNQKAECFLNREAGFIAGQDKLMGSLEVELKVLVSLEEVKAHLVRASLKELEVLCENLVEKEVARLLSCAELDKEALLYLNFIFSMFPCQVWRAAQAALQLHHNGEGSLSSSAPPDVWKTVLNPAPATSASLVFTNGKQKRSLSVDHANCKPKSPSRPAVLPVFELLCQSILQFKPNLLPRFLELAQQQQGAAGLGLSLASSSWSFSASGERGGGSAEKNVPLYKRTLYILYNLSPDADQHQDLEVELLLVSGRPTAILQALRILMAKHQWERVTQVAQEFCKKSPLLNKEIFIALLCEVSQHRELDPYLDLLWVLCPEDFTVTNILNLVLKNLPSPNNPPSSPSFCTSSMASSPSPPFADHQSSQLTIGLLKPLLRKVLQRQTKPNQCYADILRSPSFPPPVPPRHATEQSGSIADPITDSAIDDNIITAPPAETPEQQTIQRTSVELPATQFD